VEEQQETQMVILLPLQQTLGAVQVRELLVLVLVVQVL
jgi:hypothetical protein